MKLASRSLHDFLKRVEDAIAVLLRRTHLLEVLEVVLGQVFLHEELLAQRKGPREPPYCSSKEDLRTLAASC